MTLEEEKRYLLLLSSYYCLINGIEQTKSEVLDTIFNKNWVVLNSSELMIKHNRAELVWRDDFAFVRKHLVQNGFFDGSVRNRWTITVPHGKDELKRLHSLAIADRSLNKITVAAINDGVSLYPFP